MMRKLFLLLAVCFSFAIAAAENADSISRPVTQIYMLEVGGRRVLDTYLSPLRYSGASIGLSGNWSKALPWQDNSWLMDFDAGFIASRMENPPHTAYMIGFTGNFSWGASKAWKLDCGLRLTAGAGIEAGGGAFYLPRNSNNPVAVKADIDIALRGSAAYAFRIGRLPILVSDHVSIPSLGAFFSPQFGETYYEIYLGNHSGLAHCGWWGNHFRMDNLLTFDLDIGPSALRLGYRFNAYTSWVCSINTKIFTHSFVIGWIPGGIGLRDRKPSPQTVKISSLY